MLKKAFFKTIFFLFSFFLLSIAVLGQEKYWLEFKLEDFDARNQKMESFKDKLKNQYHEELTFLYQSKWNPMVSIYTTDSIAKYLSTYDFVKTVKMQKELQALSVAQTNPLEHSYALEQIKAHYITDSMNLSGKGVKIGVIDGGFMGADSEPALKHLITNQQIKFFQDYLLQGNTDPFYGKRIAQDEHGTQVLKMIAGSHHGTLIKYGMAENSELYLARTDHGIRERRLEEDYWVAAVELFYDMGIRLVNSSLGYTDGFDKRKENHSKKEVNGTSSMITRTAQSAAAKGMLIVSAAGNDGHTKWEIISLPSDAKDVLTVGAVRFDDWSKIYYSSIGPEKLDYVKPDVACFAANGTSFSAPVITGLAACIWEYDSTLTNLEIIDVIRKSSHLAEYPNNYVGYGIPDSKKIISILEQKELKPLTKSIRTDKDFIEIKIPSNTESVVIYHKKDNINVLAQQSIKIKNQQKVLKIERIDKSKHTSVVAKDKLHWEIEWK